MNQKDLLSFLRVRPTNSLRGRYWIQREDETELPSSIQPVVRNDLQSSLTVRPKNSLKGIYEIVRPPIVTEVLSPVKDSFIRSDQPTMNFGSFQDMFVGYSNGGVVFKSLLGFDISTIPTGMSISSATLILTNLANSASKVINVYTTSKDWTELGVTWANAPTKVAKVGSFSVGRAGEISVNLTDVVRDWYHGSDNYGIILEDAESGTLIVSSFGTRESSRPPKLEVRYYNPNVSSFGRSDIESTIFVRNFTSDDLPSSINVNHVNFFSDIVGSIEVNNPSELEGTIVVNKPEIDSSITVSALGSSELSSSLVVKESSSRDMESFIAVRGEGKDSLDSSVVVKYSDSDDIQSSVVVREVEDLSSSIVVQGSDEKDLGSSIEVTAKEDIPSSIIVQALNDIDGSLIVKYSDQNDLVSSVELYPYSDLRSSLFVISDRIASSIVVVVEGERDLESSIETNSVDLLESSITVVGTSKRDVQGSIYVTRAGDKDVSSSIEVLLPNDIESSLYVTIQSENELPSSIQPRILSVSDVSTSIEVRERISSKRKYAFIL